MTTRATVGIPRRYLWLVVGFGIGSYLGFAELAALISKIGGDVKSAVVTSPESKFAPTFATVSRSPSRPSTLRFYRTPEAN